MKLTLGHPLKNFSKDRIFDFISSRSKLTKLLIFKFFLFPGFIALFFGVGQEAFLDGCKDCLHVFLTLTGELLATIIFF